MTTNETHTPMAPLSPAESLFLIKPNRTPARETVKVTLLSLLAQGVVRMEEQATRRFFGTKKTVYVRPTGKRAALPPHAAALLDLVRAAQGDTGSMTDFVKRVQKAYGKNLEGFNRDFIVPALLARGLIEERRVLLFRTYKRTPAGDAEESRIASDIARARTIPELIRSNPAEAAALILAVGGTLLLVNELRPYYRQMSEVMRAQTASTDGSDSGGDGSGPSWNSWRPRPCTPSRPGPSPRCRGTGKLRPRRPRPRRVRSQRLRRRRVRCARHRHGLFRFRLRSDAGGGDGGGGDGGGGGGDEGEATEAEATEAVAAERPRYFPSESPTVRPGKPAASKRFTSPTACTSSTVRNPFSAGSEVTVKTPPWGVKPPRRAVHRTHVRPGTQRSPSGPAKTIDFAAWTTPLQHPRPRFANARFAKSGFRSASPTCWRRPSCSRDRARRRSGSSQPIRSARCCSRARRRRSSAQASPFCRSPASRCFAPGASARTRCAAYPRRARRRFC